MHRGSALRRNARAALAALALALPAPHAAALAPVAELMTEQDAAYLWSGGPPRATDRPGGWREYYFSSDVAGGALPAAGNDANPCTPDAPCLTTARMLALAAPGVHFILDDRDAWNTGTTFTSTFVLDQAAIGCPPSPDEVCVWFSTTAADSAVETVAFGKPPGSTRSCMNVLSDGTDRGWVFFDGFAVTCDASGTSTDGDGPDTNLRGKLWCHNCPVTVAAADGYDNAATAHAGGVTVISGVSPLVVAAGSSGRNPVVATTAGGVILLLTRQGVSHEQTLGHEGDVVFASCGGVCTPAENEHTPAVALIGPRLECGSACSTTTSLLELDPDAVDAASPTASALVAFTSFAHARAAGTHGIRFDLNGSNERIWFRGYRNSYRTMDHLFMQIGSQLDPLATLDVEDVAFVADGPEGGPGAGGALLHFFDPDWRTAVSSFRLAGTVHPLGDGANSQCYLENGDADVISTTLAGCQSAIEAAGPTGAWSIDGAGGDGSDELFAYDLPNGIVLPAFVTGSPIRGVYFGGQLPVAIDVEPGRDPNLIDLGFQREIPVAILGSGSLDAADVDAATLSFGAGLAAPVGAASLEDVNGDGRQDLVARYRTGDTGIAFGDTEACVSGRLVGGLPFTGCDAIRTPVRGTATGCGLGPELAAVLAALATARRRRRAARSTRPMK